MKKASIPRQSLPEGRRRWGRAQQAQIEDPYRARAKSSEPTVCPQCGAVFHEGRWQWGSPPAGAQAELCQACHRIKDKFPAGIVTLSGDIVSAKRAEILQLVRHQEEAEKKEHPMNRIIDIDEAPGRIVINTTDVHLPRRIVEALKRAFHGQLDLAYEEDGYFVRANWHRET